MCALWIYLWPPPCKKIITATFTLRFHAERSDVSLPIFMCTTRTSLELGILTALSWNSVIGSDNRCSRPAVGNYFYSGPRRRYFEIATDQIASRQGFYSSWILTHTDWTYVIDISKVIKIMINNEFGLNIPNWDLCHQDVKPYKEPNLEWTPLDPLFYALVGFFFHRLGPLACSNSDLTSETMNTFRYFGRLRAGRSGLYGSIPGRCWEFFSSPPRPERLRGPLSLLSNEYHRLFPWW
jgi:hypothetical protein